MNALFRPRSHLVFFLALLGVVGCRSAVSTRLSYEPAVVTLTGTISTREAFGPPGYGEDPAHDRKENYLLLTLDSPISVAGDPKSDANSKSESDVNAVQMIYSGSHAFQKQWLDKHVSVTGTLIHGLTGHHRTPVLIQVTDTRTTK